MGTAGENPAYFPLAFELAIWGVARHKAVEHGGSNVCFGWVDLDVRESFRRSRLEELCPLFGIKLSRGVIVIMIANLRRFLVIAEVYVECSRKRARVCLIQSTHNPH